MLGSIDALIAHQGGWDEALFVAAPLVVIAALLVVANRRANAMAAQTERGSDPLDAAGERGSDPLDVDTDRS